MKIDEKSSIPLTWFIAAMVTGFSISGATSFFVFSVNARLLRIEQKLGITGSVSEKIVESSVLADSIMTANKKEN